MNKIVAPSILSCDFLNIERDLGHFSEMENIWIHLDVMDGHFVPNLTFGIPIIKKLCDTFEMPMDAHLMVTNPEFHLDEMKEFGLTNITWHLEAVENNIALINKYRTYYPSLGVSIKPNTPVSDLSDELLKKIDLILVMSVEPGFGGQSFMENSLDKCRELVKRRESLNANFQIQIDGGISDKNASLVREAGADNLVAGSYIFKASPSEYQQKVSSLL